MIEIHINVEDLKIDINMFKKLFIFLIKYIPIIQMVGILFSNILYNVFDDDFYSQLLDFTIGNSFITIFLLYICSNLFGFCKWHKLVITANLCSILFIMIKFIFNIELTNLSLILTIFNIDLIFLIIILIVKFKCKH